MNENWKAPSDAVNKKPFRRTCEAPPLFVKPRPLPQACILSPTHRPGHMY